MTIEYTCYEFNITPLNPGGEILIAELAQLSFESFEETKTGIKAYIQTHLIEEGMLEDIQILKNSSFTFDYKVEEMEQINWNQEWEKNFEPINVDGLCYVRAPFHQAKNIDYEIVIEPKMSFGTGHHETTFLMIKQLLAMDLENKIVLDMGCGTAILAILASMKGAKNVVGIDIDNWCYENSIENCERNHVENYEILEGDVSLLTEADKYDVIIANINRNILLQDMGAYLKALKLSGTILFSGFYTEDTPLIEECANSFGLKKVSELTKNNWVSLKFKK